MWFGSFNERIFTKIFTLKRHLTSNNLKTLMDIKTFAFLDIETTGLPYQEHNKTKITELCLSTIQSEHISLGVFPRIQNKINFCFNPCKMINIMATELTGLSNELLEHQQNFSKETADVINGFLNLQRKPICLVAHNGDCFDYPILRAEIHKTGDSLPEDIVCIDSLQCFRALHKSKLKGVLRESNKFEDLKTNIHKQLPVELCDGFDELILRSVEEYENSNVEKAKVINETTPPKNSSTLITNSADVNQMYYMPGARNVSTSSVATVSATVIQSEISGDVRRRLDFGNPSFKLGDLYQRLTNKDPVDSHRAEQDVIMLVECAATHGQDFVDWANDNAKKFCEIKMMQPGRKLGT